jgi:CheY-like chemotaxis protein
MTNNENRKHVNTILLADDDADDRLLVQEALVDASFPQENLIFVVDGEDLMDYLCGRGQYARPNKAPMPDLILLDLNMPKKDGREALKEIKSNPNLRHIPVVILTTSTLPNDIRKSYDLGANTFISKPPSFEGLVSVMQTIKYYWSDFAFVP